MGVIKYLTFMKHFDYRRVIRSHVLTRNPHHPVPQIHSVRELASKGDCKKFTRTMEVEESIPKKKQDCKPPPKEPPCKMDHMMDKCPEPMPRVQSTHAPRNLVLMAGLSVLAVSIYALSIVYSETLHRMEYNLPITETKEEASE